jgi:arginine decarboxylase
MEIIVTYGTGEGSTKLAAFDKALYDAGIANYNLIKLTSVIPFNSKVTIKKINWNEKEYGDKLYVVLSDRREDEVGKEAWAGMGWIQQKNSAGEVGGGGGVFMEHKGSSKEEVEEMIKDSLASIKEYRPKEHGEIKYKITGIKCKDKPVCALVCAVYKSEGWG